MQKERYQSQINQNLGTVCHTEVCLTFSRSAAKLSEMITKFRGRASKFNIDRPLTSMASETALPYILEIASNQCIYSKDWWEVWIVGRDRTKTKSPQQWGVWDYWTGYILGQPKHQSQKGTGVNLRLLTFKKISNRIYFEQP